MRFALILAFVSSVFFTTEPASAKPRTAQKTQAQAKKKKPVKAKAPARGRKAKVAKVEKEEEAPVVVEEEAPKPEPKVEAKSAAKSEPAARRGGPAVSQATDDEVPRNEPGRKKTR